MINKKGDSTIYLIGGVIAVFVLLILFYFLFSEGGRFVNFFNFIPGFNKSIQGAKGVEIFRYDISNRGVEYYDGTKWIGFEKEGGVKLQNYEVDYKRLKNDFEKYYYDFGKRDNKPIPLDQNLVNILTLVNYYNKDTISEENFDYLRTFNQLGVLSLKPYEFYVPKEIGSGYNEDSGISLQNTENLKDKLGEVSFILVNDNLRGPGVSFILSLDNKFMITYFDSKSHYFIKEISFYGGTSSLLNIFSSIKKWRDGIFDKPMYVGVIKGHVCAKKYDNKFIVIDLAKKVGEEEKC